jgi:hypothetical protein
MGRAETGAGSVRVGQHAEGPGVAMEQVTAADHVTKLYRVHGMDLIRIAAVMLGSRAAAEATPGRSEPPPARPGIPGTGGDTRRGAPGTCSPRFGGLRTVSGNR